ncbi:MAG: PEGA domain-containing protein [Myxococcota bacterium]
MKVCPECGTQYEDHVPTCIADGVALVEARQPARVPPAPTPVPEAPPAAPPPALAPSPARWSLVAVAVLALGAGGVVALAVAGAVLYAELERRPSPQPPVVLPAAPQPVREPSEQPPVLVDVRSEPPGASVYENDQYVCDTPCSIPHPAHAPLPRSFVFKLPGYREKTVEMNDANQPIIVQMMRSRVVPASPTPGARPSIGRER